MSFYSQEFNEVRTSDLSESGYSGVVVGEVAASPATPASLEKNTRRKNQPPREVIETANEVTTYQNREHNEFGTSQCEKFVETFSKSGLASGIVPSQQQGGETNVNISSKETLLQQDVGNPQGINMKKIRKQKVKRKKHRPKVIKDIRKPVTPKPVTPKPRRARKRKLHSEEKSKYVKRNVDIDIGGGNKSTKRKLKFNVEVSQAKDGCSEPEVLSAISSYSIPVPAVQERGSSCSIPDVPSVRRRGTMMKENHLVMVIDVNSSPARREGENLIRMDNYFNIADNLQRCSGYDQIDVASIHDVPQRTTWTYICWPKIHKKRRTERPHRSDIFFPEKIPKKKRTKKPHHARTGYFTSTAQMNQNISKFLTADTENHVANENMRASECMLAFDKAERTTDYKQFEDPIPPSNIAVDFHKVSALENLEGSDFNEHSNPNVTYGPQAQFVSDFGSLSGCDNPCNQENMIYGPRARIETINSSNNQKLKKVKVHQVKLVYLNSNQKVMMIPSDVRDLHESLSGSLDDVVHRMNKLNIDGRNTNVTAHPHNALVPFRDPKKKRLRAKVDLDPESEREWKLLTGNGDCEGDVDKDKEKWWEDERRIFHTRADSFISRMHLILGDRRFSPWKGSVLDSVIGVFLTQNVMDNLSSDAFMSMAAAFPSKLRGETPDAERRRPIASDASDNTDKSSVVACETAPLVQKQTAKTKKSEPVKDWTYLQQQSLHNSSKKERSNDTMDTINYEALFEADVDEIAKVIERRGMNYHLAVRIKELLKRLHDHHGCWDLEWLRNVSPNDAKEFLLSIHGLGLKSVECIRLLTLHHSAFPVDTNVARIVVRLGWVEILKLPDSLQLHELEEYPMMDDIQKYLWPRLCKLDQRTLYELHYQMITFGKVFCAKSKPNCNACPMRGECKHFASASASTRLLPEPKHKSSENSTILITSASEGTMPLLQHEGSILSQDYTFSICNDPIIEEPASPKHECKESQDPGNHESKIASQSAIEDDFYEDLDEIPTIKLNVEEFTPNFQKMQNIFPKSNMDMMKALVTISSKTASIPAPMLKDIGRLRTVHQAYELPDAHPLLEGLDKRETDDCYPYLLSLWPTAQSTEIPKTQCDLEDMGKVCNTCPGCNSKWEVQSQTVRGTILIPCRIAMKGYFPLNGTYFQVNEVFADHESSQNPIIVRRDLIWNLPRRPVYFGSSVSTMFRGLTTQEIQRSFWNGFICVREFNQKTRTPEPLNSELHKKLDATKAASRKRKDREAAKEGIVPVGFGEL